MYTVPMEQKSQPLEHGQPNSAPAAVHESPAAEHAASPQRVIIVHGFNGNPDKHWYPWLAAELLAEGIAVSRLALPQPKDPQLRPWLDAIAEQAGPLAGTVVVTHSLGGFTILRYLQENPEIQLRGIVLVSGFDAPVAAQPVLDDFLAPGVDSTALRERLGTISVISSDNDHVIPAADSQALADRLGVELTIVPGGAHFLYSDGITELPAAKTAVLAALAAENPA